MGIMEKLTALLPARQDHPARQDQQDRHAPPAQALVLKDDFDRWLQRFFQEPWGYGIDYPVPLPEVRETERGFIVRVEVPGFDPSDLDLSFTAGALVIKAARREDGREQSLLETVPLPPDVDVERAEARVDRGVLTVKFPRTQSAERMRRIPVTTGQARS